MNGIWWAVGKRWPKADCELSTNVHVSAKWTSNAQWIKQDEWFVHNNSGIISRLQLLNKKTYKTLSCVLFYLRN